MPKDWPGDRTDGSDLVDVDGNAKGNTGTGGQSWPGVEEKVSIGPTEPGPEKMPDASGYSKPGKSDFDY